MKLSSEETVHVITALQDQLEKYKRFSIECQNAEERESWNGEAIMTKKLLTYFYGLNQRLPDPGGTI